MKNFASVKVGAARNLEAGDLMAMEFIGGITSGKVTAVVWHGYQLTAAQKQYLAGLNPHLKDVGMYERVGGHSNILVFGDFDNGRRKHMFLDLEKQVAVFTPIPPEERL